MGRPTRRAGQPATSCFVSLQIGDRRKVIAVIGDRVAQYAGGATPVVTDPVPFTEMPLRYERAYGGTDVFSDLKIPVSVPTKSAGPWVRGCEYLQEHSTTCRCQTWKILACRLRQTDSA